MKQNEQDQPAKILIVDDEPQITRVLRTALSTQGYSMRIAADGVEGMEAVHAWKPDLVITDVSMPQMNGVELCREIRAISQIPIIVLSVRNQDLMKIEALDAGADDYVTKLSVFRSCKPASALNCAAARRRVMKRRRSSRPATS